MRQPRRIDKTSKTPLPKPKVVKKKPVKYKKNHPQYGTSKLEEDFAEQFLNKLGVDYIYQFEAKEIGRFYDFFIPNKDGSHGGLLIEVDGDFWHSNPETQGDKPLNRAQLRSQRVDEYKNKWALLHGYPIMRIWESDIRKKPKEVMKKLKDRLYLMEEDIRKKRRNMGKKL